MLFSKKNRFIKYLFFLLIINFFINANIGNCQNNNLRPAWVDSLPYDITRIEGVGFSSSLSTPDSNMILARNRAREELAKYLQISINSNIINTSIYERKGEWEEYNSSLRHILRTKVSASLQKSIIGSEWFDPANRMYYAYAFIEWSGFIGQMGIYRDMVVEHLTKGGESEQEGNIELCLREYTDGLDVLQGIHPLFFKVEFDSESTYVSPLVNRKIDQCISNFRIEFISKPQRGEYDEALSEALRIRVSYRNGNSVRYLDNIPVVFNFDKGYGNLRVNDIENERSIRGTTDNNGQIECEISKILSVTNENIISATIDFSSIFKEERQEIYNGFRNRLTKYYIFSSAFLSFRNPNINIIISINGSSDEQSFNSSNSARINIRVNDRCCLNLFNVDSRGRITCLNYVQIQYEVKMRNWEIKNTNEWWELSFITTFNNESGGGVETILCIATPLGEPIGERGRIYSKADLLRELNNKFSNEWQMNTLSYVIR